MSTAVPQTRCGGSQRCTASCHCTCLPRLTTSPSGVKVSGRYAHANTRRVAMGQRCRGSVNPAMGPAGALSRDHSEGGSAVLASLSSGFPHLRAS